MFLSDYQLEMDLIKRAARIKNRMKMPTGIRERSCVKGMKFSGFIGIY